MASEEEQAATDQLELSDILRELGSALMLEGNHRLANRLMGLGFSLAKIKPESVEALHRFFRHNLPASQPNHLKEFSHEDAKRVMMLREPLFNLLERPAPNLDE